MIRYIGWRWNAEDPRVVLEVHRQAAALQALHLWDCVLAQPGLQVFLERGPHDAAPICLPGGRGIIIGTLFCGGERCLTLDETAAECLERLDVEDLFQRYWGNYVAVLSTSPREVTLARAPAATLPCLRRSVDGIELFFSCGELGHCVSPGAVRINWRRVGQQLIGPAAHPETGIEGIRELLPGWRERISARRTPIEARWFPLEHGAGPTLATLPEAARAVHRAVTHSVHAWAAGHARVMVGLSGGLDSSVVLSALSASSPSTEPVCVTHFAAGLESDERRYARAAARWSNVRHVVRERAPRIDLKRAQGGTRTAHLPGLRMPEVDRDEPELARELKVSAIFRGYGGDELFLRNGAVPAAYDACWTRRRGPPRLALLLHAAVTEGVTVWQILRSIARTRFAAHPRHILRQFLEEQADQGLLAREFLVSVLEGEPLPITHPAAARLPFGRWWQWTLATGPRPYAGPHTELGDVPEIAPLLSQPVIEAVLRVPVWLHVHNKTERAVARAAFGAQLHPEVLARRSKGSSEGPARQILREHETFLRELLLDGLLAREHIIDAERVEAALTGTPAAASAGTVALFELAGAEIWARKWINAG